MRLRSFRPPFAVCFLAALSAGAAALTGCDGAPTVADANGSLGGAPVRPAPADAAPAPPETQADPTPPREAPRPDRRIAASASELGAAPRGSDAGSGMTTVPGADPFDPEIDPSTLSRPEPVAPPVAEPPPERIDVPLAAPIPPDKQPIPDDLALPVGAVLYYQDGRDWIEVELKTATPPVNEGSLAATVLRVHRTDRPAIVPDVRIRRDQLVVTKLLVRRLEAAR